MWARLPTMASEVLKTRIKQLETMTGVKVKRVRHDGAKKYLTHDLKARYEDKGITSEMTAPYKAQQNGRGRTGQPPTDGARACCTTRFLGGGGAVG